MSDVINTHAPIIEGLLTPKELVDWRSKLLNPESWEELKRFADEMLAKLAAEHRELDRRAKWAGPNHTASAPTPRRRDESRSATQ
jgi:hypothetical protein